MKFCPVCGARLEAGMKFCPGCGAPLATGRPAGKADGRGAFCLDADVLDRGIAMTGAKSSPYSFAGPFPRFSSFSGGVDKGVLEVLREQCDFLAVLNSDYPDNRIYSDYLAAVRRAVVVLESLDVNGIPVDVYDLVCRLHVFWTSVADILVRTDPEKYREDIALVSGFARKLRSIMEAYGSPSEGGSGNAGRGSDDVRGEGDSTGSSGDTDGFDPEVAGEIEALKGELDRHRPSIKRICFDPSVDYRKELESLTGLDEVKRQIDDFIIDFRIQRERARRFPDLKMNSSFNCIFKGRPGTGKTTVARLVAGILRQEGFISGGSYVEVDASTLVSGWIGFSAKVARLAALESLDGVLFIDEAYSLMNAGGGKSGGPGSEVVDTLTPLIENYRGRMNVILAGYDREMDEFLSKANTGFSSRFRASLNFCDYTADEMFGIFTGFAAAEHYVLDEDAARRVFSVLSLIDSRKDNMKSFANARSARLMFEAVRARASRRMARENRPDLSRITIDDVSLTREELVSVFGEF